MKKTPVRSIRSMITQKPTVVREDEKISKIAEKIVEDPKTQTVYVVNNENKLVGIIPVNEVLQYLYYEDIPVEFITYSFPLNYGGEATARDIMIPPTYVKDDDSLSDAFRVMFENRLMELPVVDDELHVIGDLNALELIKAWTQGIKDAH